MQRLEVSGAVRPIYGSLGVKRLTHNTTKAEHTRNEGEITHAHTSNKEQPDTLEIPKGT